MQLVIDEYGTFVGKEGNRIKVIRKEKEDEFSVDHLNQIILVKSSSISTSAIKLAIENNVDIVILDHFGMPVARVYPCKLGGTTLTRRNQAEESKSIKATSIVKKIITAKMRNQFYLLKALEKTRENADFSAELRFINESIVEIEKLGDNIEHIRGEIFGLEGFASNQYYQALSKILPFKERQHDAKDPFNAILNYGYGILYSEVEKACILAGLDPYLGFMHSDRYGKPSMVLDLIEQFRQPIVDRAVITLFAQKQIDEKDYEQSGNSLLLTKEGRKKVIEAVLDRLHTEIKYRGKKTTFQFIILDNCRNLARLLLDETKLYEPFVHKW